MPNYRIFVAPREREFEGVNLTNITNGSQSSRGTLGIMIPSLIDARIHQVALYE